MKLVRNGNNIEAEKRFTFHHKFNTKNTSTPITKWFRSKHIYVLKCPSQSSAQNLLVNQGVSGFENVSSLSSVTKVELICKEGI